MQNPYIVTEKFYLRGLEKADLNNMLRWNNDSDVTYYMFLGAFPGKMESLLQEYEQLVNSHTEIAMALVDKQTDTHIGNVGLYRIDWITRSAEFRIIIGEKDYWSKGYGTESAKLCLTYGFDKLNLNRIWLGTNAEHKAAIRCYEKAGFKLEGMLRQEMYRHGRYFDLVRMSILREEYIAAKEGQ